MAVPVQAEAAPDFCRTMTTARPADEVATEASRCCRCRTPVRPERISEFHNGSLIGILATASATVLRENSHQTADRNNKLQLRSKAVACGLLVAQSWHRDDLIDDACVRRLNGHRTVRMNLARWSG